MSGDRGEITSRYRRCLGSRALARAFAVVQLLGAVPASAQGIPTDEPGFTAYVAERMRKGVGDTPVGVKAPLTLSVGSLQANLDRIYAYCNTNPDGCSREIDTYVRGAAESQRTQGEAPTKAAIRVVVRSTQYQEGAQRQLSPAALVPPRPLVDGLVLMPVLDSSRTVRMLTVRDGTALKLTTKQIYEVALANLRKATRGLTDVAKPVGRGQIGQLTGDFYHPSRLILVESWAPMARAQGGVLIVAAPATDAVLYISEDSPVAIDALRTLTKNVMDRAPNKLTGLLLRWTPAGWQVVP
jgi:uncharacterized protein YtpQ (UPF0354 family)